MVLVMAKRFLKLYICDGNVADDNNNMYYIVHANPFENIFHLNIDTQQNVTFARDLFEFELLQALFKYDN